MGRISVEKKDYIFDMYSTRYTKKLDRMFVSKYVLPIWKDRDFYVENYEAVRNKTYLDEVWVVKKLEFSVLSCIFFANLLFLFLPIFFKIYLLYPR